MNDPAIPRPIDPRNTQHSGPVGRAAGRRVPPPGALLRRSIRPALTIAIAGLVLLAMNASGSLLATQNSLVEMGFDPDRANLIAALLVAMLAGGVATFATGLRMPAAVAAAAIYAILYVPTFRAETHVALHASGVLGSFSLSGWLLTVVALVVAGLVVAWSGPTLALDARRGFLSALTVARESLRTRRADREVWRPLVAGGLILALVVGAPAFGALVNFTPDTLMLSGQEQNAGSATGSGPAASLGSSGGGVVSSTSAPGAANVHPWLASAPRGTSSIVDLTLPAPWTTGPSTATVSVYLPPGYNAKQALRYDTLYFVPWRLSQWIGGVNVVTMLDAMITSGRIPPTIAVFVDMTRGPYVDSECIDSNDGRDKVETFLTQTVVPAIDAKFNTIAQPSARTVVGFSQGAFCASMLTLRHPDLFGNAIALFGYYHAAPITRDAINAPLPYGGNAQLIASHSPVLLAPKLPAATIQRLYFVVVGSQTSYFYGPEMVTFERVLQSSGYRFDVIATPVGHSWVEVRANLPITLDHLFSRLVSAGVYRGIY